MHADFSHPFLLSSPVQFEICSRSPSFNDHGHGLETPVLYTVAFYSYSSLHTQIWECFAHGKKTSIKNRILVQNWRKIFSQLLKTSQKLVFCSKNVVYIPTVDKSGALGLEHGRVAVVNAAIIILSPWGNVHKWRPTIFEDFRPHPWPTPTLMSNFWGSI